MASPSYAILFQVVTSGVTGTGDPGDVLIENTAGTAYVRATAANRGSRRSTGIALTTYVNNTNVEIQQSGQVSASIASTLGAGTASWVRVSATGTLERCTPSGSDDVCGWVEADGTFHAQFGYLTATIVNGSGGGGGATLPIDLAGGAGTVINQLPAANQAAAGTSPQFLWNSSGTPAGSSGFTYDLSTTQARVSSNCGILFRNVANTFDGRVFWNVTAAQTVIFPDATGTVVLTDNVATLSSKTISGASNTLTVRLNTTDVTGTLTVGKGGTGLTATGSDGNVLTASGGAWVSSAPAAGFTAGGDLTGTSSSQTVAKVNGATVPAAGALTTGNAAYVSGVSALTYSALNLAGGAGWVTGVLPSANAPSHSGDVTGAHSATVVAKINGATVPAAGALTTGNFLGVSGASALTYQKVDTTNAAHVTVPATAGGIITSSGSVLQQPTNVLAGTNFISIGASPAATGYIRLPYNSGTVPFLYVNSSGSDFAVLGIVGSNVTLSSSAFGTIIDGSATSLRAVGASYLELNSGFVGAAKPIVGDQSSSSPYSVHGRMALHALGNNTTYTAVAADYSFQVLQFSSTTATLCTVTLPDPATESGSYFKDVDVTQCNVSQTVVFKAGAGTRTASITGSGAGVPGVPKRIFVSPGCVDLAPG